MREDILLGVLFVCCSWLACVFCGRKAGLFTEWKVFWASPGILFLSLFVIIQTGALGEILEDTEMIGILQIMLVIGSCLCFFMALFTEPPINEQEEQEQEDQATEVQNR